MRAKLRAIVCAGVSWPERCAATIAAMVSGTQNSGLGRSQA
jgi:hypothetical protein